MKKKILIYAIGITGIISSSLFVMSAVIYKNTLHNSGNWINKKTRVSRAVAGAASFMNTMPALSKFRLNLSKWQGYHELVFNKELSPEEISFKYRMEDKQYFVFFFNSSKDINKSSGIRISNNAFYPSIFFHAANHKFIDKYQFNDFKSDTNLHIFRIKFLSESFVISVDGKEIFTFQEPTIKTMYIGFRGGLADIRSDVDDLTIKQRDGSEIKETFLNWNLVYKFSAYAVVFLLVYLTLTYKILKIKFKADILPVLKYTLYLNFNLLLFALFLFIAMYSHISKLHSITSTVYPDYPVIPSTEEVKKEIVTQYSSNKNKARIWFVGSSQTWGAGVYREEDTFIQRIEKALQTAKLNIECINGGISGFSSESALDFYKENFDKIRPDITVINLSHNDAFFGIGPDKYMENLKAMMELNRKNKVTTILSVEPVEIQFEIVKPYHHAMKEFAKKENIPLIDMHSEMASKYEEGFLWWDRVHLTSYGNSLFAESMIPTLKKIISQEKK
ncbi:MAG: SGNH/GDSL hydrolase family protein [Leptospiraceae bacterium]|nr:SGNH/GDSL hydrolase family protein [Leptospiraceae bacterium]MBK9503065.1 SGNH/GDSL hydrolase family protein [Leptospiraceae bacterium]